MNASAVRTGAILAAMIFGALVPAASEFAWAIRWLIMTMLFLVFLQTRVTWSSLHPTHGLLLLANVLMGFIAWGAGWILGGREVALAAFFAGITPTATAAPVIVSFLKGRVDYVVVAFVLTNLAISLLMPALLPWVVGKTSPDLFAQVTKSVGLVVFVPLGCAWLLRRVYPPSVVWPRRLGGVSFGVWLIALSLITANASAFIRSQDDASTGLVAKIVLISLAICVGNFLLGRLIGGREFAREASQALGQKNTTLTIYLALTYASPLIALGPTAYVLWHNLWNSWQIHRAGLVPRVHRITPSKPDKPLP